MIQVLPLQRDWKFRRLAAPGAAHGEWALADLPHCPFIADLDGRSPWYGECEYERTVKLPSGAPKGPCKLYVGAAMHTTIVLVDGAECGRHTGGYLPFEIDLTASLRDGCSHTLSLRLDNRDNPEVPPGKPSADLDFCWYGGLYREVALRCYPALHITDPVAAGAVAGGGVFVRTTDADAEAATLSIQTHVCNAGPAEEAFFCEIEIRLEDLVVARRTGDRLRLSAGASTTIEAELLINRPALWHLDSPALHHAQITLRAVDGSIRDTRQLRFGIRRISFSRSHGFLLNGRRLRLRGTNRHQDYPRVGYALPAAAQRREARRIKEAGFDYVRLSHYPQSPDFLDACDEFGIVVMNCIPGWQFIGGQAFREACVNNARELIRRDRNHPCVILWELSLNETDMDEDFMARLHAAGHEEYPGDQMFTCGWQDRFDVYIHSRQHGQIHRWQNGDKAMVVAEYGDWEFYASNHGFNQKTGAGVYASWSHSRQRRLDGERGLRQQAGNHLLALNDTLSSPAVLDGQWSMFDYPRGYAPDRAACGIMDVFRLPKFSYHFYRSQRDASAGGKGWNHGPLVFIASHWTPTSALRVLIFSNCEEVELRLNGRTLGRQAPTKTWMTQFLPHPPFVFDLPEFTPGVLEAVGFIHGIKRALHRVSTPGAPARLSLKVETMDIFAEAGAPDVLFAHAQVLDSRGMLCVDEVSSLAFTLAGGAELLGPTTVTTEAGIVSVVLRVPPDCRAFELFARQTGAVRSLAAHCDWRKNARDYSELADLMAPHPAISVSAL